MISIPTWAPSQQWHTTEFETSDEFRDHVKTLFKEPGLYNFDDCSLIFNEQSRLFREKGIYCEYQEGTKPFIQYWDDQKEKCRKGILVKNEKGDEWYLPRSFYHWLNFLQIYDKRKDVKAFSFPEFRDVQYHICLYEHLAEAHGKNAVILKRRQVASSYIHIARIFNKYIFESGFSAKIGASDKGYIEGQKGCWKYLNQYMDFSNSKTAWVRHNDPGTVYNWEQKVKTTKRNREGEGIDITIGTKATIIGLTFEKDPVKGVGGAVDEFFYEEGGIAPTADQTYNYLKEAMKEGTEVTGFFAIAGSVGDLKQCEPLRKFIEHPVDNDFYPVVSTLLNETEQEAVTGLFIPIFWGLSGKGHDNFIDQYGNSMVVEAKAYIDKKYADDKKKLAPSDYQTQVSQGPRTISEAFAVRTESVFPLKYTGAQVRRIEDNEYFLKNVELERGEDGKTVTFKNCSRQPIPYSSSKSELIRMLDKRGCGVMHERPVPDAPWMTYLAAIDPVEKGNSESSESMAAVYVYKMAMQYVKGSGQQQITSLEGGKLVFEWVGRYEDIDSTNEMLSMAVELYNAWTMCEINKSTWVQHMRFRKRQKYLAKKTDMVFDKDIDIKQTSTHEYGVYMTDKLWKDLLDYTINFLSEKLGSTLRDEGDDDASVKMDKVIYGVERIPYIHLLREMQGYNDKGNFDRLKAFGILVGFIRSQEARRGTQRRVEWTEVDQEKERERYEQLKQHSPFRHQGMTGRTGVYSAIKKSSGFKHMGH